MRKNPRSCVHKEPRPSQPAPVAHDAARDALVHSQFEYQKHGCYFAQVAGKIEGLCEAELRELGAADTRAVYRGVRFSADPETLYRINYQSRLTARVLAPLLTFSCHSTRYLKRTAANIPWEKLLGLNDTFAIGASVSNSFITHSLYASQCLKDGIADYFVARLGRRPSVDVESPDVRLNLHIENNRAVISLDTSGESLHRRGYRILGHEAPMQETLAAALVRLSGWNGERPLWDCMCGSGTILCEALMHYCRIPAQILRKTFGFFHLPDFEQQTWEKVRQQGLDAMRPLPHGLIRGSDRSPQAVEATTANLSRLPHHQAVPLRSMAFQDAPPFENGILITNPPYGVRLDTKESAARLLTELGSFLKRKCAGTSAFVLIGDPSLRRSLGLKPSQKIPLENGSIACELLRVDSYRGPFRDPPPGSLPSSTP